MLKRRRGKGRVIKKRAEKAGLDIVRHLETRHGLSAAAHLPLLQDVMHVVLDRCRTDRQLSRDFFIGAALPDERKDLALAGGQRGRRFR